MPRLPRPLDPTASPVQAFAAELRALREEAGNPKYLQMARVTGRSRTALAEAAGGDHLPTWETVVAFVTACKGNAQIWREKWEQVRDQTRGNGNGTAEITVERDRPTDALNQVATAEKPSPRRTYLPYVATALAAALIAVVTTVLITAGTSSGSRGTQPSTTTTPTTISVTAAVITVQNKVALGADRLIEDSTPAYLSTKTAPYCAREGCKMTGTDMASGVMLVAVCHSQGTEMFNYNLDSSESKQNPHRLNSALWYRINLPDGRTGYLSEAYVVPEDRGGKGLPECR